MADQEPSAEELFGEVLDLHTRQRSEYLRQIAPNSPELRAEVEALLADYRRMGGFLTESPAGRAWTAEPALEQPPPQLAAGNRLGRYTIERSLGVGGMGEVYRAHDTLLSRTVAVKVLPPGKTTDGAAGLRFLNEARLASSLNHPNIVALYDIARHGDVDFLVMEYVEGQMLCDLIPERGMRFEQLATLGSQIALALDAAHAAGIVHRDIKPANIMVTQSGQAKVLDFGVAKTLHLEADMQLTGEGQIIGTVAYMSPEQTRGEALDFRSDLFSFGCVLYEAACGQPPFLNTHMLALMHEINTYEPELLSQLRPELDPAFIRLVMRCLAKQRDQRPDSSMELATELKSLGFAREPAAQVRARRSCVAVLPLRIRGAASDQFLSLSLAEALVHRLSSTGELIVRPISSVLRYAAEECDWTKPARELNVDVIVDGTIQVAGGRIRVLVQAHRLADQNTLASIKQDGDSSDLFALQDRLTDAVSEVFVPRAKNDQQDTTTPPTRNSAAFELYLRALARHLHMDKFDMASAIEMLQRATELDPEFADAWGLLAQACAMMGSHLDSDPKWFGLGEQAIARTLELDPVQCAALGARGTIMWSNSRSFQNEAALRALNAALRINPSHAGALHQRTAVLWHCGFSNAAEIDGQHLKVVNPAVGDMQLAAVSLQRGNFDRSAELYEHALEVDPNSVLNHLLSPVALLYAGRIHDARVSIKKARQMYPAESFGLGMEAILGGVEGDARRAESLADEAGRATRSMTHSHHTWHSCAAAYALAGKPDKAIDELERCGALGLPNPRFFQLDPYLRSLHGQPRFQTLLTTLRRRQDTMRAEFGILD